jgi:tetratricopeptide (TPR) repeat protein
MANVEIATARFNFGSAMRSRGNVEEENAELRAATRIDADDAEAHENLGNALLAHGKLDDAVAKCRAAIRFKPDASRHFNLGIALAAPGEAVPSPQLYFSPGGHWRS